MTTASSPPKYPISLSPYHPLKLTFLGTGTSTGNPVMLCRCPVCRSRDPRDRRRRTSALVSIDGGPTLLIDAGPDLREQILAQGSPAIDALLVTHAHYDHVGGIDDLRPYCHQRPKERGRFPVYCRADVADALVHHSPWCFSDHPYPGAPTFKLHEVSDLQSFEVDGVEVTPLPVMHGRLHILGWRIGRLGYITDALTLPDETYEALQGVDTLVINALRHHRHMSHMTLRQALDAARRIGARQTYFTHMCHQIGFHEAVTKMIPEGTAFAYDGLTIEI